MHQQNLLLLLSNMVWNTSCNIHMNPSYTKERKNIKLKKAPTNVTSNQEMQISANIRNTLTSFTHILIQIMPDI